MSRSLDALIAEKVMGLNVVHGRDLRKVGPGERWHETRFGVRKRVPAYSTDIRAAWEVVEKLREHPNPEHRTLRLVSYSYNRTYASFNADPTDEEWEEANGEHAAPEAICKAALVALAAVGESE